MVMYEAPSLVEMQQNPVIKSPVAGVGIPGYGGCGGSFARPVPGVHCPPPIGRPKMSANGDMWRTSSRSGGNGTLSEMIEKLLECFQIAPADLLPVFDKRRY